MPPLHEPFLDLQAASTLALGSELDEMPQTLQTTQTQDDLRRQNLELKLQLRSCAAELQRSRSILLAEISQRRQLTEWLFQAQEQYRGVFENALEGIFLVTREGAFLTVNPAFLRMHGYESAHEWAYHVHDLGDLFVDAARWAELKVIMENRGAASGFEYQARRKDGRTISLFLHIRPVYDAEGLLLYHEAMVEDITERLRLREQAWAAQKLQAAGHLFATIARELSAPEE